MTLAALQTISHPSSHRKTVTGHAVGAWCRPILISIVLAAGLLPFAARSADGCLVLLCLAAPSWQNIAQCVDPVRQVLRDLARGRPFPSCNMSGSSGAGNQWASAPDYCPPQYTHKVELDGSASYFCDYAGAVEVNVEGTLWSRVWWNFAGDSVTEFTPAARARLGTWDTRFDDDYARWLSVQVPPAPPFVGY